MLTRGKIVKYRKQIAICFYFSTSGGYTENIENSFFSAPVPYLKGVPDPYDYYSPLHTWRLVFSNSEMNSRLGPYVDGALQRIQVTKRGVSPRIVWARLYGTGGVTKIRGDTLQFALGGYDRWMNFRHVAG